MQKIKVVLYSIMVFLLAACGGGGGGGGGGGSSSFTVGGSLSGMGTGKSIVLQNNAGDNLTLTSNASFTFATALANGAAYAVTVLTQPNGHTCTVSNGSGTVSGANVTNVTVSCVGQPSDNFGISGNSDGTLSILRKNDVTGYATTVGYFPLNSSETIMDSVYETSTQRLFVLTNNSLYVLHWSDASGISQIDTRPTSQNSSHLVLNAAGTAAYVASGASSSSFVDMFGVRSDGSLDAKVSTSITNDPDSIQLARDGGHLYVVSRSNSNITIFAVNSDGSLAASPTTTNTSSSQPTGLVFNAAGSIAYVTNTSSSSLELYTVDSSSGSLTSSSSFSTTANLIDLVLSADGGHLYTLSSSGSVNHYTVASDGSLTWDNSTTNLGFTATDLRLSYTGAELYVSISGDQSVATLSVASDGTLTAKGWSRVFGSPNTVAAIGGDTGPLTPTARYLLAPDSTGLQRFSVATDGTLTAMDAVTSSGALIDGEAAVDYRHSLVLAAGEDATSVDTLASYNLNKWTGGLSGVSTLNPPADTGGTALATSTTEFGRVEPGGAGRVMYVLDKARDATSNARVITYAYAADGTITAQATDIDNIGINTNPENLTLNPAGNYLFSVNSYGDTITRFNVSASDGTVSNSASYTPGLTGSGVGRPLDMRFHPNGRYAYVSLEDDSKMVTYAVGTNGLLSLSQSLATPVVSSANTQPGPIAVHPNGEYVYVGERNSNTGISVYKIDTAGNYTLTHQSRVVVTGNPSWLEVDPQGRFLLARYSDESIQVFSINQTSGDLTAVQQVSAGSDGGFMPSMTLVSPLQ